MSYRIDETAAFRADAIARANTGTVGKSGNALADAVLSGYGWSGGTITYSFPDAAGDYGYGPEKNHKFSAVNAKVQDAARWTLDQQFGNAANDGFSVEGFTNLTVNAGSDKDADIRYAESSTPNPSAYAYLPTGGEASGDVWLGTAKIFDTPKMGNYSFSGIIHETGHALGLKHGHEAVKSDLIKTTLHGKYDSQEYSVMTYHSYAGQHGGGAAVNAEFGFAQTFMMADIRALQHMYGADFTTNSGATVYSWTPGSGDTLVNGEVGIDAGANRIFATIWDGGGVDTYDLSAYSTDLAINLQPGKYSTFMKAQLADLDQFSNSQARIAHGNIYNALMFGGDTRSLIENAIGGSGDDKFRGNLADNAFTGNGGNDIFFFSANAGSDTITDFTSGDRINLASMDLTFVEVKAMGHDSASGFVIDFGGGDTLTLENRTEASLLAGDFMFG